MQPLNLMLSYSVLNSNTYIIIEQRGALGLIILNRPAALNATNYEMMCGINDALTHFEINTTVQHIAFMSGCERAYCAGGDIRAAYHAINQGHFTACETFFRAEYQLTYRLATFSKPIYAFINGLTLGGGMGISVHCRARIAGENAIFGMPETAIGFFPDVGAAYFYNHLENAATNNAEGMYLALTGAKFDRNQAIHNGIATHAINTAEWPALMEQLSSGKRLSECSIVPAITQPYTIDTNLITAFHYETLPEIIQALPHDTKIDLLKKSPLSVYVTYWYMKQMQNQPLKTILDQDVTLSMHFIHHGEFKEGIRARLIDKDQAPKWRYTWDEISHLHPSDFKMLTSLFALPFINTP